MQALQCVNASREKLVKSYIKCCMEERRLCWYGNVMNIGEDKVIKFHSLIVKEDLWKNSGICGMKYEK